MAESVVKKSVSDPVHGTIPLNEIESKVMQTQVVQRLRRVKQLGLANYVYPSADYSRLAHSLGVCHITGLIMDSLAQSGSSEAAIHRQEYRLAALLHDVGHYPLSHCTEHAVDDYYHDKQASSALKRKSEDSEASTSNPDTQKGIKHEAVSELLLMQDDELRSVIQEAGYDPKLIASIFLRENTADYPLSNIISSDLDADRFDYLLRSSRATGLPYGAIDFEYLVSQLALDSVGNVCLHRKAMRAAEHFLLSRYFDYQQVVYHKAVVGLENVAQQVIRKLLDARWLDYSKTRIEEAVSLNGNRTREAECWLDWDDADLMRRILDFHRQSGDPIFGLKALCLIERRPPKLVAEMELIAPRENDHGFGAHRANVWNTFKERAASVGLAPEQYFEWYRSVKLTSVASKVPASSKTEEFEEELEKSVRILSQDGSRSEYLVTKKSSLMATLSENALFMYRIYVVAKPDQVDAVAEIKKDLLKEIPDAPWK